MAIKRRLHRLAEYLLKQLFPIKPPDNQAFLQPPRHLLIAKAAGLGDGVLIRSLIAHLRQHRPEIEIGVLVCPPIREVLTCTSNFHEHYYNPESHNLMDVWRIIRNIRKQKYDAAISFEQRSQLPAFAFRLVGIPQRVGFLSMATGESGRFLTHGIRLNAELSMWENFRNLMRIVDPGLDSTIGTLPLPIRDENYHWVKEWLAHNNREVNKIVVLHLGSGALTYRRWPLDKFIELSRSLRAIAKRPLLFVLTGNAEEKELIDAFMAADSGPSLNACGIGSLDKTAALLQHADLLISIDTGIMHLGASMGTATIGLFGVSSPQVWGPVGSRTRVLYANVECSPCWNSYLGITPVKCNNSIQSLCMKSISVAEVLAAARDVVNGNWLYF